MLLGDSHGLCLVLISVTVEYMHRTPTPRRSKTFRRVLELLVRTPTFSTHDPRTSRKSNYSLLIGHNKCGVELRARGVA